MKWKQQMDAARAKRDKRMVELKDGGATNEEIALIYGITEEGARKAILAERKRQAAAEEGAA